jgi:hypothetical protein
MVIHNFFFDERKTESHPTSPILLNESKPIKMQSGPELSGGNIDVAMIFNKTNSEKRATKIFCTLGPACWEVEQLEELINAGLNTARFNFSHGDHAGHKACLDRLRQAMKNTGKQVGKYE